MHKFLSALAALLVLLLVSCDDKPSQRVIPNSSGALNSLTVVMNNDLWNGSIGETIREQLAGPVNGLPQEEPLFDINQMPSEAFSGFMQKQRTFLKISQAEEAKMEIVRDTFAKPQLGVFVSGPDSEAINEIIREDSAKLIDLFKNTEIKERIRRITLSKKEDEPLKEHFGITFQFPTAYRYAKVEEDFIWIRKDIPHGDMNITVYQVPLSTINEDSTTVASLIAMRDEIAGENVTTSEGTRFRTEQAFAPYLRETTIAGKKTYEARGMWDLDGRFMAGPFVNYAIKDVENDRWLILEGFVFKPSAAKRDNMFELEAILKSVQFVN
ncbi:MAG: DUF4837 family protein [Leeuwenhoekiella sp.]